MIKQYKEIFKITINSNKANPTPPIGPMLGQRGINIMEFNKDFNNKTKNLKDDIPISSKIIVQKNKSFNIILQKSINTYHFKQLLNLTKGSNQAKHSIVANLKIKILYELINLRFPELSLIEKINKCKSLISTAKSIGIKIIK